jgi:predicted SprT family Zn-dependent metalloprotease
MKKISIVEYNKIRKSLADIDPLFEQMWLTQDTLSFDKNEETAGLHIRNSKFHIVVNPKFWKGCNYHKRLFIICHEYCHVIFGHWLIDPSLDHTWANIAQDIQVNEYLMTNYNFNEKLLRSKSYVTLKKVFQHKSHLLEKNKDFYYYYGFLMKCVS